MWRAIIYSLQEGLLTLWRTKLVSLLSVGTIAISFAVLGLFLLVGVNVGALAESYGHDLTIRLFLRDDVSNEQKLAIQQRLESDNRVRSVRLVSKAEAKQRFGELFPDEQSLLEELERNPLPESFEVELKNNMQYEIESVGALIDSLGRMDGVEVASYDRQWVETLEAAARTITYFGAVLGGLLVLAAIVTAANIIKINIYARREEIEIMRLVGAEGVYVRGPFVIVGLIQGVLASLLALLALFLLYQLGINYLALVNIAVLRELQFRFLPWPFMIFFIFGGLLVGLLASLLSFGRAGRA